MKYSGYGLAALVMLALHGCVSVSSYHAGPNGYPVHYLDGMTASATFARAHKLCPGGYIILGEPHPISILDYIVTIECKPAGQAYGPARTYGTAAPLIQQQSYQPPQTYPAPAAAAPLRKTKEQQLYELQQQTGLSYEEYRKRYDEIIRQP